MLQSNHTQRDYSLKDHLESKMPETMTFQERMADERKGLVLVVAIVSLIAVLILGASAYLTVQRYQAEKTALAQAEREQAAAEAEARRVQGEVADTHDAGGANAPAAEPPAR